MRDRDFLLKNQQQKVLADRLPDSADGSEQICLQVQGAILAKNHRVGVIQIPR
jgi:hypothetical protein